MRLWRLVSRSLGLRGAVPIEVQRALYDLLFEAGEDLGIVDFGYRALESMRLEKCYRLWGADLSADWSPLQGGLERFVAFDKGDFIGRKALRRELEQGPTHALSCHVHVNWYGVVTQAVAFVTLERPRTQRPAASTQMQLASALQAVLVL